ncbi:hypothetical protein ACVBGC_11950 [Burkholderia stagnalis]
MVVNPVITLKLIPELNDHEFPLTVKLEKSDVIGIDPTRLSVSRLPCGSINAMVVFESAPVDADQIPVGPLADAAVDPAWGVCRLGMASPTVTGCEEATGALAGWATTGVDATAGALAELAGVDVPLSVGDGVPLLALEEPSPPPHPATMNAEIAPATNKQR